MKKTILLLFALLSLNSVWGQITFQSLTTQPIFPQAGTTIDFTYNPAGTALANAKQIDCIVYFSQEKEFRAMDISLKYDKVVYKGKVKIPRAAGALFLSFQDSYLGKVGKMRSDGFPIKLYYKAQEVGEGGYALLAKGYAEWCGFYGKEKDNTLIISWLEQEFKQYPQSKLKFLDLYFTALKDSDLESNKSLISKELAHLATSKQLDESQLLLCHKWYGNINDEVKKNQYADMLRTQYPKGSFVVNEHYLRFIQEADFQKKKEIFENFKREFPKAENLKGMYLNLAYSSARARDWQGFEEMTASMKMKDKASLFNSLAWEWVEQNENLERARDIAAQTAEYAKYQMFNTSYKGKPTYLSVNQWKEQLKATYATYADTYGYVLYKLGKYGEAIKYLKDASEIFESNTEVNERYTYALEKNNAITILKEELEKFVRTGYASTKMKKQLQTIYEKEKNSLQGYEQYLTNLEKDVKKELREELNKKMLNEAAPHFNLVNLEGKVVSLTDFKGKTVVLNFWATWCENCISSLPILQKMMLKYAEKQAVVFLFINTWENTIDKTKIVSNFMTKGAYTFPVLIDTDDKVIDDFKVSSIFSKIIMDKNGNVRFKSTEVNTNYEMMADELQMMIEMVN